MAKIESREHFVGDALVLSFPPLVELRGNPNVSEGDAHSIEAFLGGRIYWNEME